jgi:hypothetical protein
MTTKSIFETGHAKNVAFFEELIAYCEGYGAAYQPSKATMQLATMRTLLAEARASLVTVTDRLTAFNTARNARFQAFEGLPTLTSRVVSALAITDVGEKTLEDARAIVRKMRGIRVSKKEEATGNTEPTTALVNAVIPSNVSDTPIPLKTIPDTPPGNGTPARQRSAAQTSRDQQIEHFARLLSLLQSEPTYQPNEPELQLTTLQAYLNTLRTTNSAVVVQEVGWSNARMQRDKLLYGAKTGLCDVAQDVKQYVKAAFGPSSPSYKQISKLRFNRAK